MSDWNRIRLGDLYTVHNGLSKGRQFFGKGYPFLTFSDVFNNWFLPEELGSLVQSNDHERQACSIKRGDVFITRTSETMDELGMSSVALKDYPNATYNGFTKRLRPIGNQVLPEYIGYYLRSPRFRAKFMAFSSMTTRASLSNDDLLSMEIEIPPLKVQERISETLSRYDRLVTVNQQQMNLLEEEAHLLYREWFVDSFVDGALLPQLSDFVVFIKGKTITKESALPGVVPVVAGGLAPAYFHSISNTKAPVITVSASGANAGFVRLYYERVWASDCSFVDTESTDFLYFTYCLLKRSKRIINNLQKGAAQPHVYPKDLNSLAFENFPSLEQIKRFESRVAPLFEKIGILEKENKGLLQARDTMLPHFIAGEVIR